jgi:solute:Na+ symporter, SSS family
MISDSALFSQLTSLDWFAFTGVLLLTFASVLCGQRLKGKLSAQEQAGTLELLLMGRRLTLPLFVATLVATWYGGIFGVTTLSFEKGIYNFLTQGVFWYLSYVIFALVLVKKIRQQNVVSLAELAGRLFGPKAEKLTALLNVLNLLPLAYTISLGLFLQALFGGELLPNTLIGVTIVTLYSLWGGFRAVVFSDVIQFFFMILAVFMVVVAAWDQIGSPWILLERLPPGHLDWSGGEPLSVIFVWGFIALSTLVDPNFYQRCLAAKNERVAKRGILVSIVVWFFFDLCTTLGALYARVALPEANPQNAYLQFGVNILPAGFKGLLLAGILATILSTLDSYLFNAATCVSYDLVQDKRRFKTWHHHVALVSVSLFSILAGTLFQGNVIEVWKTLGSFSAACLLFPIMTAYFFPRKISERRFCIAVVSGCIGIVSWRILHHLYGIFTIDPFYIGLVLTTVPLLPDILRKKV